MVEDGTPVAEETTPTNRSDGAGDEDGPDGTNGTDNAATGPPRWARVTLLAVSAVALLLIGAAAGMLLTHSASERAVPDADSVDVGFSQDMSVHHLQAVTMSNIVQQTSTDKAIRNLAFDIASTQLGQVGRMKGWLTLWNQPEQQSRSQYMDWMSGHHDSPGHGGDGNGGHGDEQGGQPAEAPMPGMATSEEMAKLRSLPRERRDVYFLQLMLRHHEGGVPMATQARERASEPAVRALARSMLVSQGNEIDLMTRMLAERGAEPLPFSPN